MSVQTVRLGEIVDFLTGHPFKSALYSKDENGTRLLRGDNIGQGALRWDGAKFWPEDAPCDFEKYSLRKGDVVLAMDRPWIEAGLKYAAIGDADLPTLLVQRVARLRSTKNIDARYLRYLVGSPAFVAHVQNVSTGTAVPHISGRDIGSFSFELPPMAVQRSIGATLGALDDKIELNRAMNATLEEMARGLFRSWFVDFDPVHARAAGEAPAGLSPETAALFPDRFAEDGLPVGWGMRPLRELVTATKGLSYKGAGLCSETEGVPLHNLNSIYEGGGYKDEGAKYYRGDFKDRHRVRPGDLLVANTEQGHDQLLIGHGALVPSFMGPNGLYSHHLFKVAPKASSPLSREWLYLALSCSWIGTRIRAFSNGTTVNMLPADAFELPEIPVPTKAAVEALNRRVRPMFAQQEAARLQSRTLAELRDALLPRLMSGELRVREAEQEVEAAL